MELLGKQTSEPHKITPQYVEMFHRYQCRHCHSWIAYRESIGAWVHMRNIHEELKSYSWDGQKWGKK